MSLLNSTQKRIQELQRQLDAANNVAKTLSQQAAATQEIRKRTSFLTTEGCCQTDNDLAVTPVKLPGNSSKLQPGRKVYVVILFALTIATSNTLPTMSLRQTRTRIDCSDLN
jgi:hypothetical protein